MPARPPWTRRTASRPFPRRAITSKPSWAKWGSNKLTCRVSRCPSPLKIEATELAGDVDYLADEIQPGDLLRLESLRRKLSGVDPSGGDLGLVVAFRSGGRNVPVVVS